MSKLDSKVALIIGAASGIGQAIATLFQAEGATLALADLDRDACAGLCGAQDSAHRVDVSSAESVRALVNAVVERHGRIDVLVNSAGILNECPITEMSPEIFDQMIAVNLRGVYLACHYVAPLMVEQRAGRIINIASQLAHKGGIGMAHYSAAKAGILGLTKSMARELAEYNVLTNAIAPGPISTPLLGDVSREWIGEKEAELPLGRFGRAEEVAPTALLLAASPDGDLYLGQALGPNSGDVM
ncbi:3-oxoacyl-ACP reductase [Halomonas sp. ND22Bw]|uniref:SDR family NAD(P)-dependent oxidoreductase n=1 Tax=Halomonas sp. ND22Bw TaxID=2054178 RepID=UPI000D0B78C1|nr:3-oxoacyl-ACP reductase [Halomonas sp. ND22Bw]